MGALSGLRASFDGRDLALPATGTHNYILGLLDLLVTAGASVTVAIEGDAGTVPVLPPGVAVATLDRTGFAWEQRSLPELFAQQAFDVHIVPANTGAPLRPTGVPVLLCVLDLIPVRMWREYLLPRPRAGLTYLVRQASSLLRANAIATLSRASAADIRRFSGRRAVVTYVPRIPARTRPTPPRPTVLDGLGRYVVCNTGTGPRKHVGTLVRAIDVLRASGEDLALVLVGPNYGGVSKVVRDAHLEDAVVFTGMLTADEVMAVLANADVSVVPSDYEGFCLPAVEAFAVGVPLVAGTGGSLTEVTGTAAEHVEPRDVASLAAGIRRALAAGRRAQLVAAGDEQLERLRMLARPERFVELVAATARRQPVGKA